MQGRASDEFFGLVKTARVRDNFFELLFALQCERMDAQRASPPPCFAHTTDLRADSCAAPAMGTAKSKSKKKTKTQRSENDHDHDHDTSSARNTLGSSGSSSTASRRTTITTLASSGSSTKKRDKKKAQKDKDKKEKKDKRRSAAPARPAPAIEEAAFYTGRMTRAQAEERLEYYVDGTYLVRESEKGGPVFSVRWSSSGMPGFCTHIKIEAVAEPGGSLCFRMCEVDRFRSAMELVTYYLTHPEIFATRFWPNATAVPPPLTPYDPALHDKDFIADHGEQTDSRRPSHTLASNSSSSTASAPPLDRGRLPLPPLPLEAHASQAQVEESYEQPAIVVQHPSRPATIASAPSTRNAISEEEAVAAFAEYLAPRQNLQQHRSDASIDFAAQEYQYQESDAMPAAQLAALKLLTARKANFSRMQHLQDHLELNPPSTVSGSGSGSGSHKPATKQPSDYSILGPRGAREKRPSEYSVLGAPLGDRAKRPSEYSILGGGNRDSGQAQRRPAGQAAAVAVAAAAAGPHPLAHGARSASQSVAIGECDEQLYEEPVPCGGSTRD